MVIDNNKQNILSVMEQFSCYPWRSGVQTLTMILKILLQLWHK
jgi:hypothetical protein